MSPGDITSLAQSAEIAFRVRFDGTPPERAQLYWRGPVLESFDGRRWRALPDSARRQKASRLLRAGRRPARPSTATKSCWSPSPALAAAARNTARLGRCRRLPESDPRTAECQTDRQTQRLARTLGDACRAFAMHGEPEQATREFSATRNPRSTALASEMRAAAGSDRAYLRSILDDVQAAGLSTTRWSRQHSAITRSMTSCSVPAAVSASTMPRPLPCWPVPPAFRPVSSPAIRAANRIRWPTTGSCVSPMPMPGPRSGSTVTGNVTTRLPP